MLRISDLPTKGEVKISAALLVRTGDIREVPGDAE